MSDSRAVAPLAAGVAGALALGGLATFLRLLPDSPALLPSALVFAFCVLLVAAGVVAGRRGHPDATPYW